MAPPILGKNEDNKYTLLLQNQPAPTKVTWEGLCETTWKSTCQWTCTQGVNFYCVSRKPKISKQAYITIVWRALATGHWVELVHCLSSFLSHPGSLSCNADPTSMKQLSSAVQIRTMVVHFMKWDTNQSISIQGQGKITFFEVESSVFADCVLLGYPFGVLQERNA